MMPAGAPRGGVATIRLRGKNLAGARLIVSGKGVSAQALTVSPTGDTAEARLAVAASAMLGEREARVATAEGVSGPLSLWVDVYPNASEAEPNNAADQAQSLGKTGVVLNGAIQAADDADTFALDLTAGEMWVADANVARIHSPLDPVIALSDAAGKVVAEGRIAEGGDPRIVYHCEKTGRYLLTVRDRGHKGGLEFVYRVAVGRLPVVTSVVPRGEKPGRKVAVQLSGANLGSTTRTVVTIPPDAPAGLFWSTVRAPSGLSLPFPLIVDYAPVVGLTETDALMPLPTLPCALEGVFSVYPSIRFAFQAAPKDTLAFALYTRSIGSDVDSVLRIIDANGRELAVSRPGEADARLEFTPAAEGVYTVEARDAGNKTGPDRRYRLSVRRVEPDFRVFLNGDRANLPAGSTASVPVAIERLSGFEGPVQIAAAGLPRGITLTGGTIPAGQPTAELTLTAPANAPRAVSLVTFTTSALIGGKRVAHRAQPRAPAPSGTGWRPCELFPLAVTGPAH